MTLAIETKGLWFRPGASFGIEGVNLNVPAGAIYGFLGANGAGKTTTIKLLLGLERADRGTITVLGESMPVRSERALARIGVVPERPHLHRFLTVAESLALHRAFFAKWDQRWAEEMLASLQVPADRVLSRLSKGEMGKLLILQALAQRPDLLVLDEPTDGLDPVARREVLSAVIDYVSEHRATVLISSHLVHELERLCDWVGVMDHGRLVAEMPMERLKNGIKRVRLRGEVSRLLEPPFKVLAQNGNHPDVAVWVVDDWRPGMTEWIGARGVAIDGVEDLDLEEGFVERLKARRGEH